MGAKCIRALFFTLAFIYLTLPLSAQPRLHEGQIDFLDFNFERESYYVLNGEWEFYPHILVSSTEALLPHTSIKKLLKVPKTWNSIDPQLAAGAGFGTYRLKFKLANPYQVLALRIRNQATAYKVFLNSELKGAAGNVASDPTSGIASYIPQVIPLGKLQAENELIIQVSNWHHRKGGLWNPIIIGDFSAIVSQHALIRAYDFLVLGALLLMMIFSFGLYAIRKDDKSLFGFGALCVVMALRIATSGERIILDLFPALPYEVYIRIEYFFVIWTFPSGLFFISRLLKKHMIPYIMRINFWISIILSSTLVLPPPFFTHILLPVQILVVLQTGIIVWVLVRGLLDRAPHLIYTAIGGFIALATGIYDMLNADLIFSASYMAQFGFLIFVLMQSRVNTMNFAEAYQKIRHISTEMVTLNESLQRFVPYEFIHILGKTKITDLKLGDYVESTMTIMFTDIRDFTQLSEKMTPQENFNFLNHYMNTMAPIIREHNGFIDKYIGDGIMALFPKSADDALRAAIAMLKVLTEYNAERIQQKLPPIQIGMGIHTGDMILGTLGEATRMEGTVISSAVNLAARLQALSKQYSSPILISRQTLLELEDMSAYVFRIIDKVKIKGKDEETGVVEIFNGLPKHVQELILKTKKEFELGASAYSTGNHALCVEFMEKVLRINPQDKAAQNYLSRARNA